MLAVAVEKLLAGGAMAIAAQHSEISAEWTHGLAILMGHHPRNLMQMGQVVSGPGGQQFGKSNHSEDRMFRAHREVTWLQIQGRM